MTWLDDCSRYALSLTAHVRITGPIVLATFRATLTQHGIEVVPGVVELEVAVPRLTPAMR